MRKDPYDEKHLTEGGMWDAGRTKSRTSYEMTHIRAELEGWVAGVAAVAAVGASAYSAYSSSKSQQAQLDYQKNNAPVFHSYTPVLAQYNPTQGVQDYTKAVAQYGGAANQAAQTENGYYQQSLQAVDPGLKSNLLLASKNATNNLKGNISPDVASSIARASAQQGLTGGFSGSESGRNLTARDFGETSQQLQQLGATQAGQNATQAAALNPVSAAGILGTSQEYAQRADQYNMYNTGTLNKAAADNAGVQNQNAVNQYQAGLAGVQAAGISPVGNSIASGVGALASVYGGGYGKLLSGSGGSTYGANQQISASGNYNPYLDPSMYNNAGSYVGTGYG